MKQVFFTCVLILILSLTLSGCGPLTAASTNFAGEWTANIGTIAFTQEGNTVTGVIDGYGGNWHETFTGKLNEKGEAVFNTEWFGDFTLVMNSDNTFRSTSSEVSLCGVRGSETLPLGCGFSGKWIVPAKFVFLEGSYMILTQTGANVTGDLYSGNNTIYDSFTGSVDWGKGWRANGETKQRGDVSLWINASETGFEFVYGDGGNSQELCAVREGAPSAHLGSFNCTP